MIAGIKGGVRNGAIRETKSRTGIPRWLTVLVYLLVSIALAEPFVIGLATADPPPLDCAKGTLTITGSTAFAPVVQEATAAYANTCREARFTIEMAGSSAGLDRLNQHRGADMLAFSDGVKGNRVAAVAAAADRVPVVRIVDGEALSGARTTFEQQVLGAIEPGENSNGRPTWSAAAATTPARCSTPSPGRPARSATASWAPR